MKRDKILSSQTVQKVAHLLKTIGHPVRLQILEALERKNCLSVSELSEIINLDVEQSLLSHHLIKMRDNGILRSEKRGMYVYYSITDRKILNIFNCMDSCDLV